MRVFRFNSMLRETAAILTHVAHGGLLAGGLLAGILVAGNFSGTLKLEPVRDDAQGVYGAASAHSLTSLTLLTGPEVPLQDVAERPANGESAPSAAARSSLVDYLSKRYRVAAVAIEPLIDAAHVAGSRVGVDPLLIVAVMGIESGFNPFAESPIGAKGLMQVVPRFHQDKLGRNGADERAFLDPLTNILVGARVLKESIRRAGGLEAGLQQYAGAAGDADNKYATKVIAERQRLERAMHKGA